MGALDRLPELVAALRDEGVEYVLFGGQAVNLHGILRFTDDIDLFVSPEAANIERLRRALRRVWDDPAIEEIRAEDFGSDYGVIRYGTPDDFYVDLVTRIGEVFSFPDIEFVWLDVDGVPARVASPRTLYRMKKDTVRPLDRADAADLRQKFRIEDE